MPDTPTGTGSVDYVLFADNLKPLAVIEAKRTTRDAKEGQHQAYLYANCLQQMTGFRPLIFYTNGYTTWLWDDLNYTERKVYSVFSKKDIQRIIDRRTLQKEFRQLNINPEITDRDYQKAAIQSVCSDFSKKKRKALLVMATGTGKTTREAGKKGICKAHAESVHLQSAGARRRQTYRPGHFLHIPDYHECHQ